MNSHSLTCSKCNEPFTNRKLSLLHQKIHHPEERIQSNLKSESAIKFDHQSTASKFQDKAMRFVNHAKKLGTKESRDHVCAICSKGFRSRQHLRRHEFTHREKPTICKQCCLRFDSLDLLKEHRISTHADGKEWVCEVCGLAYDKYMSYRDHVNKIHFAQKKQFKCELCHKVLSNRNSYETHIRTHSGDKPFVCTKCGNSYYDKYSMAKHEKLHETQVEYACPLCQKKYHRSCLLSEHIKWTHATTLETELNNYECSVCHEKLLDADCYLQHVYNHACEKIKKMPVN